MTLKLDRTHHTDLYTEGQLTMLGIALTNTVEASSQLLPPGLYQLRLVKLSSHCRRLTIFPIGEEENDEAAPQKAEKAGKAKAEKAGKAKAEKAGKAKAEKPDKPKAGLCTIMPKHSWLDSQKHRTICIGRPLIPGVLKRCNPIHQKLLKRVENCQRRKEPVLLIVQQTRCHHTTPSAYWL